MSAFASSLGTATGASRILYAMGRDGFGTSRLGTSSQRTGAPAAALVVVMTIAIVAIIGMRLNGTNVVNAFFYPGTIGVLSLLVAYVVTNVGAIKLFAFDRQEKRWEMGISVLGIAFLLYVLWRERERPDLPVRPLLAGRRDLAPRRPGDRAAGAGPRETHRPGLAQLSGA